MHKLLVVGLPRTCTTALYVFLKRCLVPCLCLYEPFNDDAVLKLLTPQQCVLHDSFGMLRIVEHVPHMRDIAQKVKQMLLTNLWFVKYVRGDVPFMVEKACDIYRMLTCLECGIVVKCLYTWARRDIVDMLLDSGWTIVATYRNFRRWVTELYATFPMSPRRDLPLCYGHGINMLHPQIFHGLALVHRHVHGFFMDLRDTDSVRTLLERVYASYFKFLEDYRDSVIILNVDDKHHVCSTLARLGVPHGDCTSFWRA